MVAGQTQDPAEKKQNLLLNYKANIFSVDIDSLIEDPLSK